MNWRSASVYLVYYSRVELDVARLEQEEALQEAGQKPTTESAKEES